MPEYIFRGSVTMNGVVFTVTAKDSQEAIEKARQGEFDDFDASCGEAVDWEIRPGTCERND